MKRNDNNIDKLTVHGFGDEWKRFTQSELSDHARERIFSEYFSIFDWGMISSESVGADFGCGSGRWAQVMAPRVGYLVLLDASYEAINVAKTNLMDMHNVGYICASIGALPIKDSSLDFAYSLGVLHHMPDTASAIKSISAKLKKGAPFLLYLYYAFDNRTRAYAVLWKMSDLMRRIISRLPNGPRYVVSQVIAATVYFPLARLAVLLEWMRVLPASWPLAYYRDKSFYVMRTDALDRFGTRLEQRFTRAEIESMLRAAGFENIRFSRSAPFWCAFGTKS